MLKNKLDIFALCETIQDSDFQVPGYLPIHRNDAGHMHGLCVYAKSNFPIARETILEDENESDMCFRLAPLHSITFIFFLYRSLSSSSCSVAEAVSSNIDMLISWYVVPITPSLLRHSHLTDVAQDLAQIVDFITRIPDRDDLQPYLLDLFLSYIARRTGLRDHPSDVPWLDIFKHDATYAAEEITEWVEIGIDCYIP